MSNSRPPGFRGPGKNTPPNSPGFPGGQRPPVNNGLNSWNGPTWTEPSRPPGSPPRFQPPKSNPFPKTPPKPPGLPPSKPPGLKPPAGPGVGSLGKLGGGILGGVLLDLLFPSPVSDGTLPPWYQPPAPPGGDPTDPVDIDAPYNPTIPLISGNGKYEITNIVATYRRISAVTGDIVDPAARYLQESPNPYVFTGPAFKFTVPETHGTNDIVMFWRWGSSTEVVEAHVRLRTEKWLQGNLYNHELVSLKFILNPVLKS